MIIADIKLNNIFFFNNFHANFTYPKKIIGSSIPNEYIPERPNFRYKKVNIIMGANATGKTTLGEAIMSILNFLERKEYSHVVSTIGDINKAASFSIDLVVDGRFYSISTKISVPKDGKYTSSDIKTEVKSIEIGINDSYESCIKKIDKKSFEISNDYIKELEKIPRLSWYFNFTKDNEWRADKSEKKVDFVGILQRTLIALDPRIRTVTEIAGTEDAYLIKYENNKDIILKDGKITENILSSGTECGIAIANLLASIKTNGYKFFYFDEKFSYVHSDLEKAFLSVIIDSLNEGDQLFFTTHNSDILEMNLPKHTYMFLKRDIGDNSISCVYASDYLKKNTDSLKNSVDNDLFGAAPSTDDVYRVMGEYR